MPILWPAQMYLKQQEENVSQACGGYRLQNSLCNENGQRTLTDSEQYILTALKAKCKQVKSSKF